MYTRLVQATIKSDKLDQFKDAITNQALPLIRQQPGFVDAVEMYSGNRFACMTFWRSKEDAERYARDVFPQIIEGAKALLTTNPTAENYEVSNDTVHRIGMAA